MAFGLQKGQPLDISIAQKVKIFLCDYKSLETRKTKALETLKRRSKLIQRILVNARDQFSGK